MMVEAFCNPCGIWQNLRVSDKNACKHCGTPLSRMETDETEDHKRDAYERSKGGNNDDL